MTRSQMIETVARKTGFTAKRQKGFFTQMGWGRQANVAMNNCGLRETLAKRFYQRLA